jgi:hypothetical protein
VESKLVLKEKHQKKMLLTKETQAMIQEEIIKKD